MISNRAMQTDARSARPLLLAPVTIQAATPHSHGSSRTSFAWASNPRGDAKSMRVIS